MVHGTRPPAGATRLTREQLLSRPAENLGQAVTRQVGLDAVRRSTKVLEPSIRGLSGERVQTQVEGIPLYGACPSKMDPPINYLALPAVQQLTLSRALPSVTWGPPGSGGRLRVSLDYEQPRPGPPQLHADLLTAYDSAHDGFRLGGAVQGGDRWLDLRVSTAIVRHGDYRSADGLRVPARQHQRAGALSVGVRPAPGHRLWQGLVYLQDNDTSYPALPMDNRETSFWLYGFNYRLERRGMLQRLQLRGGLTRVQHLMDNRDKANRSKLWAATPALSQSYAAAAEAELRLGRGQSLQLGADLRSVLRDARRTRRVLAANTLFEDHVWPDTAMWDSGLYAEASGPLRPGLRWVAGLRGDVAYSSIGAGDDPSLGGRTVRQQYERAYGPGAGGQLDRTDWLGSAQLKLLWTPWKRMRLYVGTGGSMRPAAATERSFAFGPAPGGFQVGNPTLAPEKNWTSEAGLRLHTGWLRMHLGVHAAWIKDFIYRSVLEQRDVDGDGTPDTIRGFRNTEALLWGAELRATLGPWGPVRVPLQLAYLWGDNRGADRPLPEISPLHGSGAVRLQWGQRRRLWVEAGARFALAQRRVDQAFGEDETDGHVDAQLRLGLQLDERLELQLALENVLDAQYNDHLTREALLPAGDLAAGDEVPVPGRRLLVSLRGHI